MLILGCSSTFFPIQEKDGQLGFWNINLGRTSNFFQSTKQLGNFPLDFIFRQIVKKVFQARHFCRSKRGIQFMIKLPVFKKNKFSYLYYIFVSVQVLEMLFTSLNGSKNCKTFLRLHCP